MEVEQRGCGRLINMGVNEGIGRKSDGGRVYEHIVVRPWQGNLAPVC